MSSQTKLTEQETKITEYLISKNNQEVYWEELVQFAKDPQSVKKKTLQKVVSNINKKYSGLTRPFNVIFKSIADKPIYMPAAVEHQKLVKITFGDNIKPIETRHEVQVKFDINRLTMSVKNTYGEYRKLNLPEWNVFKYLYERPGQEISIDELRDKVVFEKAGSRLPARWYDSIQGIINNIRKQVDGIKWHLKTSPSFTNKSGKTSYCFQ